jgi:hypothetical protein
MKADTTDASQINGLLMRVEKKIPENYRFPGAIIEGKNWRKSSEFVQLKALVQEKWAALLSNLATVAPSETDKTILFVAFQSIPSDNYLEFLDRATVLAQTKVINRQLLKWALFPGDKNVRGVLDYNYEKPVVKNILQGVKALYADDPSMLQYCDAVLSGQAKKGAEGYFNEVPADARPNPAEQRATP